jgi:hypothetical protein
VGCLEFDGQTVYLEYDKANDRLALIINYVGLYAGGDADATPPTDQQLTESVEQLDQGVSKHTVALLSTFPFAFSAEDLRAEIERPDKEWPSELRRDALALLGRARVLNGGFYTDEKGRLCGAQVVFIEQASQAVPLVNRVVNQAILWDKRLDEHEDEVARVMVQRAQQDFAWLRLEGNSLVVHLACPESALQEPRRDLVRNLLEPLADGRAGYLPELQALLESPVLVWQEGDLLRIRLGLVNAPSRLVTCPANGSYLPNLLEHVRATHGLELDGNLARYLVEPKAAALTEAQEAARLMAPRLTQRERARVLVGQLHAAPSEALRKLLRAEGTPPGSPALLGAPSDEFLLRHWERWLGQPQGMTAGPEQLTAPGDQP